MNFDKQYPIGIQSFEKLRRGDCYYVDKTAEVWKLSRSLSPLFLSRPRRFGKSLLLSTLEAYFRGKRELFEGLAISHLEKEWKQYPVLHFDFNTVGSNDVGDLTGTLNQQLRRYEEACCITSQESLTPQVRFMELIRKAAKGATQVVILIDEYDKPLLNTIDDAGLQNEFRKILKPFYGALKTMDRYIRFAMVTGVARFGKVSVFSDLNNLRDISLEPEFNAVCGITEEELYSVFADSIEALAKETDESVEAVRRQLKSNYDGYHFGDPGKCKDVYNPFSLITAFANKRIGDYWFDSGTPTFLIKRMIRRDFSFNELNGTIVSADDLLCGITADDSSVGQLFQTGYLTIKEYDRETDTYTVDFPNHEVEKGFDRLSLQAYSSMATSDFNISKFRVEVIAGKPDDFMKRLQAFTADFPYDQIPDMEVHWHNVMYLLFKFLGFYARTEYKTSDGRIDAVVKTPRFIYVFEFKLDSSPEVALEQINSKNYPLPFEADGRKLYRIGVEFTSKHRRIKAWKIVAD